MTEERQQVKVHGECDARFAPVQHAFARGFESGDDIGASVAVVHRGAVVVDLWAGTVVCGRLIPRGDSQSETPVGSEPWQRDTLVTVLSATKGLAALAVAMLVDRGLLDYAAPVARYWPAFASASKSRITVADLVSHQAGLPVIDRELAPGDGAHWERMVGALELEEPVWEPGTRTGYHAVTWSWLVGELVRKVAGCTLAQFAEEEICRPLGIEFPIGCGPELDGRVADLILPPLGARAAWDPTSLIARAMRLVAPPVLPLLDTREFRNLELSSTNGCSNARNIARLYGALAAGGAELLDPAVLEQATAERCAGMDAVLEHPVRRASGWHLSAPGDQYLWARSSRSYGHSGAGGALGFADPEAEIGFGFAMNRLLFVPGGDPRWTRLVNALYECLAA